MMIMVAEKKYYAQIGDISNQLKWYLSDSYELDHH